MTIFDFDYETYYDKEYTVKTMGNWCYMHDPRFDAYLLSVEANNGFKWVGNPQAFEWGLFDGQIGVAHNAGFDFAVTERLKELKLIPEFHWNALFDTADLAAYLGSPRDLKGAALNLLGMDLSKETRDKAKGKHWNDMDETFQQQMIAYGAHDAHIGLRLWMEHGHKWPAWERELSRLTREMCWTGLPTDPEKVKKAIRSLESRLIMARALVPWAQNKPDAPVLSLKEAALESRRQGILPPKSFAKDSEEFEEWLVAFGEKLPWARALGEYRSVNMLLKKLVTLRDRTDENGIFRYGLKYGGAHTLRDSGEAGFNVQNLARKPMFGVDVRGCTITAPAGYTLGIVDERAIEPCVLAVLAEDTELVDLLRQGHDPYDAQARISHGYIDPRPLKEADSKLRQYMKVEVLACGFGAGAEKVRLIAKTQVGLDLDLNESENIVKFFRKRKFIPNLWSSLENEARKAAPGSWELELPSGRIMNYRNVKSLGSLSAEIPRLGKMMRVKLWGGSLTENLVQATARDIFMWHVLQIAHAGFQILLRAHDEVVVLLKESEAEQKLKEIISIMRLRPPWLPDFPAAADGGLSKSYKKL